MSTSEIFRKPQRSGRCETSRIRKEYGADGKRNRKTIKQRKLLVKKEYDNEREQCKPSQSMPERNQVPPIFKKYKRKT